MYICRDHSRKDKALSSLGVYWNQWEEVWCDSLKWKLSALTAYWDAPQKKSLKEALQTIHPCSGSEMNQHAALFLFYIKFREVYTTGSEQIQINKDQNFEVKRQFLCAIKIAVFGLIALFVVYLALCLLGYSMDHMLHIEVLLLPALILAFLGIGKELDIMKYQETWSRHTQFQYLRNQEMLRFLLHLEPYIAGEDASNVECFVKAILEIEGKNIAQFCDNMDNKEKGMLNEVLTIVKK